MTIYLFGEVQPHRKSCHFLIRARESRIKLCAVGMRNTILGNDLKWFNRHKLWHSPKCVLFTLLNYSSLSYIAFALSTAVNNLSNKTSIFHVFQGPTIKFHDFPGFPWPVWTLQHIMSDSLKFLILNEAQMLSVNCNEQNTKCQATVKAGSMFWPCQRGGCSNAWWIWFLIHFKKLKIWQALQSQNIKGDSLGKKKMIILYTSWLCWLKETSKTTPLAGVIPTVKWLCFF